MGYYTELKCTIPLRYDTPVEIIELLKKVIVFGNLTEDNDVLFYSQDVFKPQFQHEFFKCERWFSLLLSTNFGSTSGSNFIQNTPAWWHPKLEEKPKRWTIYLHTSFKNYDNEIEHFIDWISPYVLGRKQKQYIGWYRGDDDSRQTNIYIERPLKIKHDI